MRRVDEKGLLKKFPSTPARTHLEKCASFSMPESFCMWSKVFWSSHEIETGLIRLRGTRVRKIMSGRFRYDGEVGTLQKRYLVVHDFDASVRSHNQISNRLSDPWSRSMGGARVYRNRRFTPEVTELKWFAMNWCGIGFIHIRIFHWKILQYWKYDD